VIESHGGPGRLWFLDQSFTDIRLRIEWMGRHEDDVSGVLLRLPAPFGDPESAVAAAFRLQIDHCGVDPGTGSTADPISLSGAVLGRAAARPGLSRGRGRWNVLEATPVGPRIDVRLNGEPAAVRLLKPVSKEPLQGSIALQGCI